MDKKIYIETIDENNSNGVPESYMEGNATNGRQTVATGIFEKKVNNKLALNDELTESIKNTLKDISEIFVDTILADEAEVEFSIAVTGNGNICLLSGSSSVGMKVTLKWKK